MAAKNGCRDFGYIKRTPKSRRFQASYIGPDGKRHYSQGTFAAKIDADRWLVTERGLIDKERWTPPRTRVDGKTSGLETVSEFATRWVAQRTLSRRTRDLYESQQRRLIDPTIGTRPLIGVRSQNVREWFAGLGKKCPTRNAQAYGLLHAVFETALDDEIIEANPCRIPGAMNAPTKRAPVIFSVTEINALVDAMKAERLKALVLIAAWLGLRWGELVELRRKDVNAGCESITVSRAAGHRKGCHVGPVKEKQIKTVTVPPHIRADLKHHLDMFVAESVETLLFPPVRGGCHLNDRVFRKDHFDPALAVIGRETATEHDLRHFAGTTAARAGGTPKEVQGRLGHRTAKAAMIYQHIAEDADATLAQKISEYALAYAAPKGETNV